MYGYIEHVVGRAERDISHPERVEADEQLGALAASISRSVGILRNRVLFPFRRRHVIVALPATVPAILEK